MTFNPDVFSKPMDPMATVYETCPEGEFQMMLDSDPKQVQVTTDERGVYVGIKQHKGVSQRTGDAYDFTDWTLNCIVMDEGVKKRLGREQVFVRLRLRLDFDEAGDLAKGPNQNVGLGQLRDVLGQNKPGWAKEMLLGAGPFIGKVVQTSDQTDPLKKYADVKRVTKIS